MKELQYAGEYDLQTCEIISSAGVVAEISANIVEINMFESIFSSAITGNILFTDTNNLQDNLPLIGQEYISLKIVTPGLESTDRVIDFTENVFCLYEVGLRQSTGPAAEIVEGRFCSPELLRNERVRVSKSFEDTTDEIVKEVLQNPKLINTKKQIFVEKTSGIRKVVSPNYHPFKFIENLARESMSIHDNSPHFLFYENIDGFHFRTIQSLYSQGVGGEYHVGDVGLRENLANETEQNYKRIINFQPASRNNSLADVKGGMLGSTLIMHDIYNKNYKKSKFEYFNDHNTYMRLESSMAPKYNNVLIDDENTVENFVDARIHLHPTSLIMEDMDSQFMEYPSIFDPLTQFPADIQPAEAVSAVVSDREQKVMERLINEHDFSPEQAAGVVGNLNRESKLRTGALNPGDGTDGSDSIGIAQWNSTRAQNLKKFARSQGKSYKSLNLQTDFIVHELKGSGGNGGGSESAAWNRLETSGNSTDAASAFATYERFRNYNVAGNQETRERQSEAKRILNKYNSTRGVDEGLTAQTKSVEIADLKAQVENTQTETIQGNQPYVANKNIASNRADKWLLHRNQRLHELNTGMAVNMSIHGSTTVSVGQVISIEAPINGLDHEKTEHSKLQSGLFLISKIRHTFSQPTRTHLINLQCTKDSYPVELESKASGQEPKSGSSRIIQL